MWLFKRKSSGLRCSLLLSTWLCLSLYWASSYSSAGTIAGMPPGMVLIFSFGFRAIVPVGIMMTLVLQIVSMPIFSVSTSILCTVDGCQALLLTFHPLALTGGKI